MNFLTTFCSLVLGITIGVTFNHHRQLDDSIQSASNARALPPINIYTTPNTYFTPISGQATAPVNIEQPTKNVSNIQSRASDQKLEEIANQQKALLRQLAEQSKEIQSLTFRQDTFSDKFIPLRKETDSSNGEPSPASGLSPLLPPIQ